MSNLKDLVNTMSTLQADKAIAEELRSKVDQSVQDTIITSRIMDGFRNPQQNGAYLKNHANFPIE
jgi:nucleoporin p58/p45